MNKKTIIILIIVLVIILSTSTTAVVMLQKFKTKEEFINFIAPFMKNAVAGTGLFASVGIAQAIIESGWGKSSLTKEALNFFGITKQKNDGWNGDTVVKNTREVINGKDVMMHRPFRKYPTVEASFRDRTSFLIRNKRYTNAGVFKAKTPFEQAEALQRAGYATDPKYSAIISKVIRDYNLIRFDS